MSGRRRASRVGRPPSTRWRATRGTASTAWRAIGVTTAAVLIVGLAIGANTAIFSVVNAVLFREQAYADPDANLRKTWRRVSGGASKWVQ